MVLGQNRMHHRILRGRNIILIIMSAFGKLELKNYFNNSVVWFRAPRTLTGLSDDDYFSVTGLETNISKLSPSHLSPTLV